MDKESSCNAGDSGDAVSIPESGSYSGGGHGNPLIFLLGEFHGLRSLASYSP